MKPLQEYSMPTVRVGVSLVFLWFGISQLLNPSLFLGWLPSWITAIPLSPVTTIYLNGAFETVFGALLIAGLFTRVTAALLALHLFGITVSLGYNDIAVRDIGLTIATAAVSLNGYDQYCVDARRQA